MVWWTGSSQDLDVATENPAPMESIAATVREGLTARGWQVELVEADPLSARLIVTDAVSGGQCEVDILKEVLWRPPVRSEHGLVLSLRTWWAPRCAHWPTGGSPGI